MVGSTGQGPEQTSGAPKPPEFKKTVVSARPLFDRELLRTAPERAHGLLTGYFLKLPGQIFNYMDFVTPRGPHAYGVNPADFILAKSTLNKFSSRSEKYAERQSGYELDVERGYLQTEHAEAVRQMHDKAGQEYNEAVEEVHEAWNRLYPDQKPHSQVLFWKYIHAMYAYKKCRAAGPERVTQLVNEFGIPQVPTFDGYAFSDPEVDLK
jgi:hypothetical protein